MKQTNEQTNKNSACKTKKEQLTNWHKAPAGAARDGNAYVITKARAGAAADKLLGNDGLEGVVNGVNVAKPLGAHEHLAGRGPESPKEKKKGPQEAQDLLGNLKRWRNGGHHGAHGDVHCGQ